MAEMDFPNWRLHALKGDLAGYWSLTVNGNWRVTFRFEANVARMEYGENKLNQSVTILKLS